MSRSRTMACVAALAALLPLGASGQAPTAPPAAQSAAPPASQGATPSASRRATPPVTTLEVAVSDERGRPVEGAVVIAEPVRRPFGPAPGTGARSTVTDRSGKATLESLPAGPWNVFVSARGLVPRRLARMASGPLTMRLEKGGSITGVVRESRRRQPVAGARVFTSASPRGAGGLLEEAARNETLSDARGRFRLDGIGGTATRVVARARGFDEAAREARAGDVVELVLFPGATLGGVVRDDAGRPVPGATVRAEGERPALAPPSERSDARGEFLISGVRPGAYVVVAREGVRAPGIAAAVVAPESEARVALTVSEGGFVTGRVVDPDGQPLRGQARAAALDGQPLPSTVSDVMAAAAGADGSFVLGPLPLGLVGIEVKAPRYAARVVEATIARRATADLGDVALETGLTIRGQVRDREGNGIGGVSLRARLRAPGRDQLEATSESDGRYLVAGLKPGRYELVASSPGFASVRAAGVAGGDPVDLVMVAGGEIAGRVVDAEGRAVEDASVTADLSDESDPGIVPFASGGADEGEGRFVLRDLAAGRWVLKASARDKGETALAGVRVAAGQRTEVGTLSLRGGGVVRGVVVAADGQGISGATVAAERDTNLLTGESVDETDPDGRFEIRAVPPGRVMLLASHPAYAPPDPVVVEVALDQEPAPTRIVMREGARVEGRALHRDGRPVANARVACSSLEAGSQGAPRLGPAPVGQDGWFTIDHVAAGRAQLGLMVATAPGYLRRIASREALLREGETAVVDFSLRDIVVAGTVTRGGQPAPGVRVSVMVPTSGITGMGGASGTLPADVGPPLLSAVTREDGGYELLVFVPGQAWVTLESVSGGQRYPRQQVELPDVERFELNLELSETTVSGVVVDKGSAEPVPDASVRLKRSSGRTGPDGTFAVAAEPGDQELEAQAVGYKPTTLPLSVGAEGRSDVRVELEHGLAIRGRVLGLSGAPAPGVVVMIIGAPGEMEDYGETLADGSFLFTGRAAQPVTLVAGGALPGWALRSGVAPGGEPLTLALRPGGRILLRVLSADDLPVKGAYADVQRVGGVPFASYAGFLASDDDGRVEIASPAGVAEIEATAGGEPGRGSVTVPAGGVVPLEIVLPASAKEKAP